MQLYRLIYYSLSALHVSGDVFAHHQEHLTVFTASGNIHQCRCWLMSRMSWNSISNSSMTPAGSDYKLFYYSLSPLHVSANIFAHHQKHLSVFTASGNIHQCRCRLVSRMSWNSISNSSMTPAGRDVREYYQML